MATLWRMAVKSILQSWTCFSGLIQNLSYYDLNRMIDISVGVWLWSGNGCSFMYERGSAPWYSERWVAFARLWNSFRQNKNQATLSPLSRNFAISLRKGEMHFEPSSGMLDFLYMYCCFWLVTKSNIAGTYVSGMTIRYYLCTISTKIIILHIGSSKYSAISDSGINCLNK